MPTLHKKAVFIFRRDVRLEDNLGLLKALAESEMVIPLFIFDPAQTDASQNPYFSKPAFSFLCQSLQELSEALERKEAKLFLASGNHADVVRMLIEKDQIDAVYCNKDYTPFSRKRDKAVADVCTEKNCSFFRCDDTALTPLEEIRTNTGGLYSVFTPFMKKASLYEIPTPVKNDKKNYYKGSLVCSTVQLSEYIPQEKNTYILKGGRREGLKLLTETHYLKNYSVGRNIPSEAGTSRLSAHHKFGTISIRETYHMAKQTVGVGSQFISELYWREFYYYIAYHFPIVFKKSFLPWAEHLAWKNNKTHFQLWCEGRTGVPIVDAGMRELLKTGWLHNRSRMIVASYLTKNLYIDWRWGERYFATALIDYDPSQNNGGWQWSASTGADPRPLRIFNPYTQAAKYDMDADYIKKWVPELAEVDTQKLTDGTTQDFSLLAPNYPKPVVDQKESFHSARTMYAKAKEDYSKSKK
jgi:deoxyribodipyrimidine photo-lyase